MVRNSKGQYVKGANIIQMQGQRYGRLTVLCFEKQVGRKSYWRCICDCGNEKVVRYDCLKSLTIQSCGCLHKETCRQNIKNPKNPNKDLNLRLMGVFHSMRSRCYDPTNVHYDSYGGRGIAIYDEWMNNQSLFRKWAFENGFAYGLTIDRIDNDGIYEPGNCRWSTREQQQNNRRQCVYIEHCGEKLTLTQWARKLNIHPKTLSDRYHRGLPIEKVFYNGMLSQYRANQQDCERLVGSVERRA